MTVHINWTNKRRKKKHGGSKSNSNSNTVCCARSTQARLQKKWNSKGKKSCAKWKKKEKETEWQRERHRHTSPKDRKHYCIECNFQSNMHIKSPLDTCTICTAGAIGDRNFAKDKMPVWPMCFMRFKSFRKTKKNKLKKKNKTVIIIVFTCVISEWTWSVHLDSVSMWRLFFTPWLSLSLFSALTSALFLLLSCSHSCHKHNYSVIN